MIPISSEEYDVIVAGGGSAGVVAAIASARNGARTLLIEKNGFVGGDTTAGLVFCMGSFHNQLGEQVVKGIPQEIVDRAVKLGAVGHVISPVRPGKITMTFVDEEVLKFVEMEMLIESGVNLLLHTIVFNAFVEENKIRGLEVANKSGRQVVLGKVIVDATGDGDVSAYAGAPYIKGRKSDRLIIPPTMMFKMSNVNIDKVIQYIREHPEQFAAGRGWSKGSDLTSPVIHCNLAGFTKEWNEALEKGELSKMIDPEHSSFLRPDPSRPDEVLVNMTRILNVDATDAKSLTYGEIEGRRQAWQCAIWLKKYIPGFENARLMVAPQLGIREGRRIIGEYILTGLDVTSGRKFDDVIAKCAVGLDIHEPSEKGGHKFVPIKGGGSYDIPYRCIVPQKIENLLVAGRCISADDEAFSSIRWTVPCMATGQAAGTAAALAVKENVEPRYLNTKKLQETLLNQNVILYGVS